MVKYAYLTNTYVFLLDKLAFVKYVPNIFSSILCIAPAQPINISSKNITSTSYCITFDPPTNITQNGPIASYTVTYQGELFKTTEYNITVSVDTVVYPLTESSSVCISNLEEYDNYTVLIRANNGAREGAAAIITVETLSSGVFSEIHSYNVHN